MRDRITCPECGGWLESTDGGEHYYCDTCEYSIGEHYQCDTCENSIEEEMGE